MLLLLLLLMGWCTLESAASEISMRNAQRAVIA
jgi:hypothetical protein